MKERITVSGFVATEPEQTVANERMMVSTFRIGTTERIRDWESGAWRDGHTNWFTVKAFRDLARNVLACVHQGEPVVVTGNLKVKKWRREDGTNFTFVELEADAIGHDLAWGTTKLIRTRFPRQQTPDDGPTTGEPTDGAGGELLDPETGELVSAGPGSPSTVESDETWKGGDDPVTEEEGQAA